MRRPASYRPVHWCATHNLAWAVIGDVTSPVDIEPPGIEFGQPLIGNQQVGAIAVAPDRVNVGMFEEQ